MAKKDLSQYVSQVMSSKGLSARDVARKSGNKITAAYVTAIMQGSAANPSVDKLRALSRGLDLDPHNLFDISCGLEDRAGASSGSGPLEVLEFLDVMRSAAISSEAMEIVRRLVLMSSDDHKALLKYLDNFPVSARHSRRKR
jgi:transcriptional regulator with XRE-family HTH domain